MGWPIRKNCATNGESTLDTNILIDYLTGREQARDELSRYEDKFISIITWMEVLIGAA